jgi:leucyl aminopeptidase (aminopeptidase T)
MMATEEQLDLAAENVLKNCMALNKGETVHVVTDAGVGKLGFIFFKKAYELGAKPTISDIPTGKTHGEEPPHEVAESMKKADIALLVTYKSLSHTKARREACDAGTRIASMPGITEDIMARTLVADYSIIRERCQTMAPYLENAEAMRVTTPLGTDLEFSVKDRHAHGKKGGIYDQPGTWGNLPEGEIAIGPVEGTANGKVIIDASISGLGMVNTPSKVEIKDGYGVSIEGGQKANNLLKKLEEHGKEAFNIAEFGIGLNEVTKIVGNVLEDEKVLGTAHFAFGNNMSFEGNINVSLHLDCVFNNPTIWVDDKMIEKDGKPLVVKI